MMNKRAYRAWLKEVHRIYKIMYGYDFNLSYKETAMVEFWFEHGTTEGKAVTLVKEWFYADYVPSLSDICPISNI